MKEALEPQIKQPPANTTADLLTPINLTCTAEGHPTPTYEWYKDGVLIPEETRSFLFIPEPLPEDRGSYMCKAINNQGNITSKQAQLEIPGITCMRINMHVCVCVCVCVCEIKSHATLHPHTSAN